MPPVPPVLPPFRSQPELRRDAEDRVLGLFVDLRALGSPLIGGAAAGLALFDDTPWRRTVLLSVAVVFVLFSVVERYRFRRVGPRAFGPAYDLGAIVSAQVVLVFVTGGLGSPFAPTMLLVAFFQGLYASSAARASLATVAQVPAVWFMAYAQVEGLLPGFVPRFLTGFLAPVASGPGPYVYAAVMTFPLVAAPQVARRVRHRLDDTYFDALTARDRGLALYAEQAETLSRLGAEIAHELKNPLSSIKGLGALLAKRAEGKDAERLSVLRREVDRMQAVLDEMLAFGRPVVPLEVHDVDLRLLASEVITVHEGVAAQKRLTLRAELGPASPARCDPRKILQVLTNLVQNSIDATPPGGEVVVRATPGELVVCDDGPGLGAAVADRVFEAGVTTKATGTGIGLTIARALALQHGGELAIGPRRDGRPGAEATLTLPLAQDAVVPVRAAREARGDGAAGGSSR